MQPLSGLVPGSAWIDRRREVGWSNEGAGGAETASGRVPGPPPAPPARCSLRLPTPALTFLGFFEQLLGIGYVFEQASSVAGVQLDELLHQSALVLIGLPGLWPPREQVHLAGIDQPSHQIQLLRPAACEGLEFS